MTDITSTQLIDAALVNADADAVSTQVFTFSIQEEQALTASSTQIFVVSIAHEYEIPLHLHGWLVKSIQGFPYYIE